MVEQCERLGSNRQWYVCLTKSPEDLAHFNLGTRERGFPPRFGSTIPSNPGQPALTCLPSYVSGDESFSDCYQVTWSGTFKRFAGIIKSRTILLGM